MICPACARHNRDDAGYCAWCGVALPVMPEQGSLGSAQSTHVASDEAADTEPWAEKPPAVEPTPGPAGTDARPGHTATATAPEQPGEATLPFLPRPTIRLPEPLLTWSPLPDKPSAAPARVASSPIPGGPVGERGGIAEPLSVGDVLAGRYEILEVVTAGATTNEYRTRDLYRCAACGYENNAPEDAYCNQCGALRDVSSYARVVEHVLCPPETYDVHFSEDRRDYYVALEVAAPADEGAPSALGRLRIEWGHATDAGRVHDHNEDYLDGWLYEPRRGDTLGLFVVADGLGGQDAGEVASHLATQTVWESLRRSVWEPVLRGETLGEEALAAHLGQAVVAANDKVYQARTAQHSDMSTTLTLALVAGNTAQVGNVGDSRTYLWNSAGLRRLTKDHSLVEQLVDAGEITREEVYSHPRRNLIYQSIGDRPELRVDLFRQPLAIDDRLVLCSDGLWEMVRDEGIEETLLAEPDPQRAADLLVHNANLAGGEDNISVIIVQVRASGG